MKKISAIAAIAASLVAAAPAVAMDAPTVDAFIHVTPMDTTIVGAEAIDASNGSILDSFSFSSIPVSFGSPSEYAEFSPSTNKGYFTNYSDELFAINVGTEDGIDWITDINDVNAFLPTSDGVFSGLAIDDATNTLYLLVNDPDAGHFFLVTIDPTTGPTGTPLEMPTALTDAGAIDIAIDGGKLYVLTGVDQISIFNLSDGSPAGSIAYPEFPFFSPLTIDASEGGILRIVSNNADSGDDEFFSFDINSSEWSNPTVTNDAYFGMAWYGVGNTPTALAETGTDASGALASSVALLAVGGAIALRRRARR